jgi:UPF0042 nucleotide-binding protein
MAEFILITGMSGAGRSEAAKHLDDLGWFVIDNLPPTLMTKVSELAVGPGASVDKVAFVIGTGRYRDETAAAIEELRADAESRVRVLFLQARTPVLVRRYDATRRRHPFMDGGSLAGAIEAEREALEPIKAEADVVLDTSDFNVHQLRDRIVELFGGEEAERRMQTRLVSFGFKYGLPLDVDLVIDCRFLPNPHWVEELRPQTGLDEPVRDYVLEQDLTQGFLEHLEAMLELLTPAYAKEGKAYLTVAFGCTGGRHRSVAITERIATFLDGLGYKPSVTHRDMQR